MDTDTLVEDEVEQELASEESTSNSENAEAEAALEEKVKGLLQTAFADSSDSSVKEMSKSGSDADDETAFDKNSDSASPEAKTEDSEGLEKEDAEDELEKEQDESASKKSKAGDADSPTLPDSYRRSLKAYGWTDDEIAQNLKSLGSSFIGTAAKIHSNRNAEITAWATAGRKAREQNFGEQKPEQNVITHPGVSVLQEQKLIDAASLKAAYGDDELVDAIVKPVNAALASINAIIPFLTQGQTAIRQAEQEALSRQISEFFGTESLKPYQPLYGDGKTELSSVQVENRNKVLETADALIYGANAQGRSLTVQEALLAAHDLVSVEFKTGTVRESIKKEAKQRNQGLMQKPGNRAAKPNPEKPRTMKELEAKVGRKLAEVFRG